jgi:hypothetical protein
MIKYLQHFMDKGHPLPLSVVEFEVGVTFPFEIRNSSATVRKECESVDTLEEMVMSGREESEITTYISQNEYPIKKMK